MKIIKIVFGVFFLLSAARGLLRFVLVAPVVMNAQAPNATSYYLGTLVGALLAAALGIALLKSAFKKEAAASPPIAPPIPSPRDDMR